MYNLCNAVDHVTDFCVLMFRMTFCGLKFESNSLRWYKGKAVLYSESDFWRWMLSLLPDKWEVWDLSWGMGFGFLLHGLYPGKYWASSAPSSLPQRSQLGSGLPQLLCTAVVADVSQCQETHPTLWCPPRLQLSSDSLAAMAARQWALMADWMLLMVKTERCSLCVVFLFV